MQNLVGKGLHLLGKKVGKGTKIIKWCNMNIQGIVYNVSADNFYTK